MDSTGKKIEQNSFLVMNGIWTQTQNIELELNWKNLKNFLLYGKMLFTKL